MRSKFENINTNSSDTPADAWQKMADEVPTFEEKDAASKDAAIHESIEKDKSPEQLSLDLIREMLTRGKIHPLKEYDKLAEFVKLRSDTLGIAQPVNLFLRSEYWDDGQRRSIRYNPATDTIYNSGNWGWTTRAYHNPDEGTFVDFPMQPSAEGSKPAEEQKVFQLEGGEAAIELISLAYTVEHELQHDLQFQRLENKEISYDTLRLAKDTMLINTLGHFTGDAEYFYTNAHDAFYIEKDANAAADEFLDKVMPIGGTLASKIANPDDPPEHQHTFYDFLLSRRREGEDKNPGKQYALTLSKNQIKMPEKTYTGEAEDIIADYCDDLIAQWPDYIKVYPALGLEYNDDGSRRSKSEIEEILQKANEMGSYNIGGKEIPAKKLKVFYHKLLRDSKLSKNL